MQKCASKSLHTEAFESLDLPSTLQNSLRFKTLGIEKNTCLKTANQFLDSAFSRQALNFASLLNIALKTIMIHKIPIGR